VTQLHDLGGILKAWLVLLTVAFLIQRALVLEPSCMFFGNTKLLLRSILIGLSSSSRSSSRARNMSLLSASAEAPKRRMLFLHGQFPPPECYINKLASAWLETVENGGWECKAASRLAILSLSSHEAEIDSPCVPSCKVVSYTNTCFGPITQLSKG
jgi:hypothetical protein